MIPESNYTPPHLNAEEAAVWREMPVVVKRQLEELDGRIRPPAAASRMWERLLSQAQRQQLGGDLETVWPQRGTLRLWMDAFRLTNRFVALTDLAFQLNLLAEGDYKWLLRESSLASSPPGEAALRPQWDPVSGSLTLNGVLIRRVRIFKIPSHVQRILDAFENAGWPPTIRNPLSMPRDQQQLHRALHQLNGQLQRIRFAGSGGAQFITWSLSGSETPRSIRRAQAQGKISPIRRPASQVKPRGAAPPRDTASAMAPKRRKRRGT